MPDQIKKYFDPLRARWDLLTTPQRYKLLSVIAVVLIAVALTAYFAFRTQWETIASNQNLVAINPMRAALDNAGIRNRTRNHNSALQVDRRRAEEAWGIIQLEGAAPNSEHFTWANALDTGLGATDDERRRRDILGMEGAIASMLMTQNGIIGATVILDIPNTRPFDRNAPQPSAAITITITEEFSASQGRNLAMMVSRSLSQLELDNIIILDQFMRTVFSGDDEAQDPTDQAQQIRTQHTNHVLLTTRQLLSLAFDEVGITPNFVFEDRIVSEEVHSIYRIPEGMDGTGIVQQDTGARAEMEGSPGGLEPGLQPQTATFPNYAMPGGGIMSASQREWVRNYLVDNVVTATTYGAGGIVPDRSSAAIVVVNNRTENQALWMADVPEGEDPRTDADWERFKNDNRIPTSINGYFDDFEEFHALVASAMGLPIDNVSFMVMERILFEDTLADGLDIPTLLMVAVLLLLLAMLLYGLLRRQRAAGEEEEALEPQLAVEDLLVSTQLEEAKEEAAQELEEIDYFKENEIKKHIEKFVNEKPEAVAALLRNWINIEEW